MRPWPDSGDTAPQGQGRKNRVSKGIARLQSCAGYEREGEATASDRLGVGNRTHVEQQRALNSHEADGCEHRRESLDRLARDVGEPGVMVGYVVAGRLDILDLTGID